MPPSTETKKQLKVYGIYLLIILLFALAIRLIYFVGLLEGDDLDFVYYGHYLAEHGFDGYKQLDSLITASNRPGQYTPAAITFLLFGTSELSIALFPLLASLITCYLLYRIGCMLANQRVGLIAAFLWAVFPLNVFLATQLDPEGPLTMASTASIFFLLLAERKNSLAKAPYFGLSALFLAWAILIKASVMPIIFVIGAWLLWTYGIRETVLTVLIKRIPRGIKIASLYLAAGVAIAIVAFAFLKQPWAQTINSTELTATDIGSAWFLGEMNPVGKPELGNWSYFSSGRELYTPIPASEMLSLYPRSLRFTLFDAFSPLLLIGAITIVLSRKKEHFFPLIWFAIVFFYLEWGTFPRGASQFLFYLPLSHWISPDNLLYATIPMILILAVFLSDQIKPQFLPKTLLAAILLILASAFLLEYGPTQVRVLNLIAAGLVVIAFFAWVFLPEYVSRFATGERSLLFSGLLILIGIVSLNPAPHYHISDFGWQRDRRANLYAVNAFLESQPEYPILFNGLAGWLDAYAGFEYGWSLFQQNYTFPGTRLTTSLAQIQQYGGYRLEEGCGEPVESFELWPWREFGNPTSDQCISLLRSLPEGQIGSHILAAREGLTQSPSPETVAEYIDVSAEAGDFSAFIFGLSEMVTRFPSNVPITSASGIISSYNLIQNQQNTRDLLAEFIATDGSTWEFGRRLEPQVVSANGTTQLEVGIERQTDDEQPILLQIELRSRTAYILDIELTSFAPFDLVRFPDAQIPDSFLDSWNRAPEWEHFQVIFVTPEFETDTEKMTLELARLFDRGSIQFRAIELTEVSSLE